MSNFVHRTTRQLVRSGNDPDYPVSDWIVNPDLSAFDAIGGYEAKYATVSSDAVLLMDKAARDAVDAAALEAARDATAGELDATEALLRAFALVVLDEINVLRAQHGLAARTAAQLKTAVRNKLGA